MKRTSHLVALIAVAVLALGNVAARPQATTLRGIVFNDLNANGKLDAGEPPLVDYRVQVSTPDLSFVQEYRSGSDGSFGPAVGEGTFVVRILPPEGWSVTTKSEYTVFVQQGTAALGLDFGLVQGKAPARPASSSSSTSSPGTLPATGGERPSDPLADLWPILAVWFVLGGAAFIAVTALAPRTQRK